MGQINYIKRTPVPVGASTTKMLSGVTVIAGANPVPISSQVLHIGYGGQRGVQVFAALQSGTMTEYDITLQGRCDETCPWFELFNAAAVASFPEVTSNGADTGYYERLGSTQGSFPEMRILIDVLTGVAPIVDAWLMVSLSA